MSFIERALEKARLGTEPMSGSRQSSTALRVGEPIRQAPSLPPVSRVAETPQVLITETLLKEKGLRAEPDQDHQIRAEYRHIKHRLMTEIRQPGANRSIVIASALQGEGKSFSSINLALSLALEPDYSVLLIDGDVIRPNLTRIFGLSDRPGLMELASDERIDPESLILSTNIEGLSILPAGHPNPNATELFSSSRMREVMDLILAVPNRLVVLDSLPLLLTTESRALTALGGQVVLVVRAESTPRSAVQSALDIIGENANVKLLLNAVVRTKLASYLDYGHGYGYNYNYGTGKGE